MAVETTTNAVADREQSTRSEMPTTIDDLRRSGMGDSSLPAIDVKDLKVYYDSEAGVVKAVDGVSFALQQGERLALVGESGCGKTTLGMALMKLTKAPGYIDGGQILLDGRDLVPLDDEEMRLARLAEIALVTQSAMNALNPVMRIEDQIFDGLIDHGIKDTKENLRSHVYDLLLRVGLRENVGRMFPHELSGGMKQRVAIATGTSMNPKVIVADEPTSALDVVVQRQVMMTLSRVQRDTGAAVILIGHDMGLVAQFADRIGVMYAGKLVDIGTVQQIIEEPKHPYTKLLINSVPDLEEKRERLTGIPGIPPPLVDLPPGCVFAPRCPSVEVPCNELEPKDTDIGDNRHVMCHLFDPDVAMAGSEVV
ncbi:MAG: ABC transporter ATP-binding protein [Chloroflexi bacterium]|nr:ABC transporter ATP-binding protein [Chloroflexota bacterium]